MIKKFNICAPQISNIYIFVKKKMPVYVKCRENLFKNRKYYLNLNSYTILRSSYKIE
jgi:hypothetical protein